jgi:hypothetical protein
MRHLKWGCPGTNLMLPVNGHWNYGDKRDFEHKDGGLI